MDTQKLTQTSRKAQTPSSSEAQNKSTSDGRLIPKETWDRLIREAIEIEERGDALIHRWSQEYCERLRQEKKTK